MLFYISAFAMTSSLPPY